MSSEQGLCLCPYCKASFIVGYKGPRSATERSEAKVEQQRIFEAILRARLVRTCGQISLPDGPAPPDKASCMLHFGLYRIVTALT